MNICASTAQFPQHLSMLVLSPLTILRSRALRYAKATQSKKTKVPIVTTTTAVAEATRKLRLQQVA
jgi:maleate cis-trans isomerase